MALEATTNKETAPVAVEDLSVLYNGKPALWRVSYEAPQQGLVAIVGPNGAGKTTFIKACLDLVPKVTGRVTVFGEAVAKNRSRIGYVPQRNTVDWDFPISVLEVVAMGTYAKIGWLKPVKKAYREWARECLNKVGMANYADRQIGQLSGGQQQRIFLARALAQEADLYFMDEPFAGVDAATEKAILEVLNTLDQNGKTVICVHHDLDTVSQYFEHILMLNIHVVAAGSVNEVMTDDNLKTTYGGALQRSYR